MAKRSKILAAIQWSPAVCPSRPLVKQYLTYRNFAGLFLFLLNKVVTYHDLNQTSCPTRMGQTNEAPMNKMTITLTLFISFPFQAFSKDIFFQQNSKQFVMTTDKGNSIHFAGCSITGLKTAKCTAVAEVDKDQFPAMRACTNAKIAGNIVIGAGGFLAGVAGYYPLVLLTGLAWEHGDEAYDKGNIYSDDTAKDVDHYVKRILYDNFIANLEQSLESSFISCDVSSGLHEVSRTPFNIKLSPEQQAYLLLSSKRR